ncbi:fused MFS/spermidine synthase [Candidatus Chloroploca sp. M-50]|uniref:Fused MFS/spermidine synthase n=1 Tax=Candidatus Chloroploca mongolica TaxID=2528176 RepID=A0ABS4D5Z7_9CHLR|nr:fused MFS/spermidine synthase [Candidatus Chloroploca mongolica]MBP1464861.1 fused MFS/spermidine synthase [Candidatus Chloroploca mongolica]
MRVVYTITIFVSALLLFLLQPMFARMILPLLGGTPAVWNTAMVFYQSMLLVGYAYAHVTIRWLGARRQAMVHLVVMLLPLLTLPIAVPAGWLPPTEANPAFWVLALLTAAVGLPYFVVSTSSPLLQAWFAAAGPRVGSPYTLYAASNLGSMLALLSYPVLLEPYVRLDQQSLLWSIGYGLLVLLALACALVLWRLPVVAPSSSDLATPPVEQAPTWRQRGRWVLLATVPSSLLLSLTTYVTTDLAAIPLLWVWPLALYLLTFTLVFAARPPLPHWLMVRAMPMLVLVLLITIVAQVSRPFWLLLALHLGVFFVVAMVCHGELAADRPVPRYLTEFYLLMSVGGALGGIFNALIAPTIFVTILEYPLALILAALLLPVMTDEATTSMIPRQQRLNDVAMPLGLGLLTSVLIIAGQRFGIVGSTGLMVMLGIPALIGFSFSRRPLRFGLGLLALLVAGTLFNPGNGDQIYAQRTFFGVHRVLLDPGGDYHVLVHGNTKHGVQSLDPLRQAEPLSYYTTSGPLGQIFAERQDRSDLRVGGVGMGTASMACYARPGQSWTFYEIDPEVIAIARDTGLFTFLSTCLPDALIVPGDARLSLQQTDRIYDLLVLDAYSSDAIPIHLITREALQLYRDRLADDGLLAFHISNRFFDLEPILAKLADDAGMIAMIRHDLTVTPEQYASGHWPSSWAVLADSEADLGHLRDDPRWRLAIAPPQTPLWTDDFASVLSVMK